MSTNSSSELLCPNWVFSNNSNVHTCKNRNWFTDYTPFESTVSDMPVLGVGTVTLPTKKTPTGSGRGSHGQLVLHDVLHIPSILCNIIGLTKEGRSLAYFDATETLFQVKLSGPPVGPIVGPTVFNDLNALYWVFVRWDQSELARWEAYKQRNESGATNHGVGFAAFNIDFQPSPKYTDAEKAWLKTHWRNEFEFLRTHGLSIYDEEQRDEGRAMARAFMTGDDESEQDDSADGGEASDDDMEGHVVDYLFDHRSLDWIEKHYGTSLNFMASYGLKFYDQEDCEAASDLVGQIMRHH